MTAWGAIFAPIAHTWYNGLEKVVTGKGVVSVVSKVAADQLIFTVRAHRDVDAHGLAASPTVPYTMWRRCPLQPCSAASDQLAVLLCDYSDGDGQPGAGHRPDSG